MLRVVDMSESLAAWSSSTGRQTAPPLLPGEVFYAAKLKNKGALVIRPKRIGQKFCKRSSARTAALTTPPSSWARRAHSGAVRVSSHTMALCKGRPLARSHTTTVSRWLVMPTARTSSCSPFSLAASNAPEMHLEAPTPLARLHNSSWAHGAVVQKDRCHEIMSVCAAAMCVTQGRHHVEARRSSAISKRAQYTAAPIAI